MIHLNFGDGAEYSCPSSDCHQYGMHCGATLSVRIVDADTLGSDAGPGSDASSSATLYGDKCITLDAADSDAGLCAVKDAKLSFDKIPTRTMQVQVAIWPPPPDGEGPRCPNDVFDLRGIPRDKAPQPAFGGVAYVEAGTDRVAEVMLACRDPELVDEPECLATNLVTVTLDDMQNLVPVRVEDAPSLSVEVGQPTQDTSKDPPVWVIKQADTHPMGQPLPTIPPLWKLDNVPGFTNHACVLVAQPVPQPSTVVSCTNDLSLQTDGHLALHGLMLPESVLDELLSAANITALPSEGIVVGRVVDAVGAPLAGVTVKPLPDNNVNLLYVDATRTSVSPFGPTSADGFFLSRDAPFDTVWEATDTDGRVQDGEFRAGLVSGKVSVVVIQMTEP